MKRVLYLILAFFLPPVAVALLEGFTFHFWLNIVLWIVGVGILGIIHAFYLILTRDYPAFH